MADPKWQIKTGDCLAVLKALPDESVQMCVTSPPYFGLRDYGVDGQIGLEETPERYVKQLVAVFEQVRRVLRPDGTLWLNLGDSYANASGGSSGGQGATSQRKGRSNAESQRRAIRPDNCKPKDLIGIPWAVAFALRSAGWWLRQDIIWHKPNPMPESVTDRCVKAHEYVFLLSKSPRYCFDHEAVKELAAGGNTLRNRRSVWTVTPRPFKGAHFATYPPELIEPCILAGSRPGDMVLDPFNGAGTTGVVALKHGRRYLGIELNPDYVSMSVARIEAALTTATRQPASGETTSTWRGNHEP